ncbi:MAG: PEP-CTERM-box response regulator transcription factor, partial [Kangiellaceae bacterium]|nr:PEP-CTERM-box response regulator transcription factor [Kangiellaceae bacterium]
HEPPVVTLDLGLPPDPANASEGLAALEEIMALAPTTKVIVITGNDDTAHALKAIELGAYDFYQKPIDTDTLAIIVERAFKLHQLEEENRRLARRNPLINQVIGESTAIQKACRMVEKISPTEVTTLLLGQSGTGKEVFANAIHELSPRSDKPFIAINCGAIPENLLESELFGYEKGAFTGAHKTTKGKIEGADGGTLFLDEIGDMPLNLQVKLLRFLQERVIERVGGRQVIPVDVRVICATHQNLYSMVEDKSFREDLFYRVSEIVINIPPLKDRDGDVVLIARALLQRFNQQFSKNIKGFTDKAMAAMSRHSWPGNIRELQNKLKSAVIMAEGQLIDADDLGILSDDDASPLRLNLREVREEAETKAIVHAYSLSDSNMSKTAAMLGVTRPTLYSLVEKYNLSDLKG